MIQQGLVSYLVVITNGKRSWDGVDNTVVLVIRGWHGIEISTCDGMGRFCYN